jgi:hypothetical protein
MGASHGSSMSTVGKLGCAALTGTAKKARVELNSAVGVESSRRSGVVGNSGMVKSEMPGRAAVDRLIASG